MMYAAPNTPPRHRETEHCRQQVWLEKGGTRTQKVSVQLVQLTRHRRRESHGEPRSQHSACAFTVLIYFQHSSNRSTRSTLSIDLHS